MYHAVLIGEPSRTGCIVLTEKKKKTLLVGDHVRVPAILCITVAGGVFFDCEIFLQILATNLHEKQCREFFQLSLSNAAENFTLSFSFLFFPSLSFTYPYVSSSIKHYKRQTDWKLSVPWCFL